MPDTRPIVFVVDDDTSVCISLQLLVESAGWTAETYASAGAFLSRTPPDVPSCLILDVHLSDLNGLELQQQVVEQVPIIFMTGFADVATSVRAMKAGAVEFLTKPFGDDVLLDAVAHALARSAVSIHRAAALRALRARYTSLTCREQQVMALVARGRLNKQVGGDLGISEITVKAHRGSMMRKMNARTLPDLVDMAMTLGVRSRLIA